MILANVNIGSGPSTGDGDPLRSAFSTINTNFQKITNNVNALSNSVTSVAGRTGNVVLTVNDVISAASVAYVNSQVANAGSYSNINVTAFLPSYTGAIATVTTANIGMKGYVDAAVAGLVDSAPGTLDTLNELAAALGDDPNLSVTLTNTISNSNTALKNYVDGQVSAVNVSVSSANVGLKGYVDQANTIQATAISQANVGLKGYVDQANTIQATAISQANLGMKGYVDSVAGQGDYANANVAAYLVGYSGNIAVNTLKFDDLSEQHTAYTGTQWRSNLSSNVTVKPSWMSYYPGLKNQLGTQYGFDSSGMFFSGNADNDIGYPIRTNLHIHGEDTTEIIATINFANTNDDHGIAIFNSTAVPVWRYATDTTRIAFQFSSGTPRLYGQTTQDVSGTPVVTAGNDYTIKFVYNPGNTVTVYTYDGPDTTGTLLDTRTINEVLPAGDYVIGFDADQDGIGAKSYFTNIIVRTLTDTVVNDIEVTGQVTGNLIPSANVAYSLGNITHQWKDLWVSNSTVYFGGIPLSIDANSELLVNGVSITSTVTGITSNSSITITNADSGSNSADISLNSADDITLQGKDRLPGNDIEGGDINIYAGDGSSDDDTTGDTSGGGDIQIYGGVGGAAGLSATAGAGGFTRLYGGNGGSGSATRTSGDGGDVQIRAGNAGANVGGGGADGGQITIFAGDSTNPVIGGIVSISSGGGGPTALSGYVEINIPSSDQGPGGLWTFNGTGTELNTPQNASIFGATAGNLTVGSAGNTFIKSVEYATLTEHIWQFSDLGNLTLPAGGQILDSTGNIYAGGSSYSNVQVATYLPTYTGNVQAGNVKVTSAYRFASGAVTITNGDSHVELSPDTGTNALAGVKVGGNGYILGPNASRNITLNYGSASGVVGMQSNVVIGTGGSGNLWVYGNIISRDITAGNISATGTSGKLGYNQGGFAQQITSNATQVTSNTSSGNIQLMSIDLGVSAAHTVTFACNKLTTDDMLLVKHVSGGLTSVYIDAYVASDGLAVIWLRNISGIDTGAFTPMLKYAIIRAPSS